MDLGGAPQPIPYGGGPAPAPKKKASTGGELTTVKSSFRMPPPIPAPEPELDDSSEEDAEEELDPVAQQAKEAAEEAAELVRLQAEDKEQVVLDIAVLYSEDGYVDAPPGYWKVPYDLNKGAGGNFIYLATKTCQRQDPGLEIDGPDGLGTPITDLCVITGKSKDIQAPVGYTKVEGDLNYGTGGNFVFLCYHRGQLAEPVSELFVMGGKPAEVLTPPPGFAKIDADLNSVRVTSPSTQLGCARMWFGQS
jgi:hypothetical protein